MTNTPELNELCSKFNIDKKYILDKYVPMEYRIFKYAYLKILQNKGYSINQIALNLYNPKKYFRLSKSYNAVSSALKKYEEWKNLSGNKNIVQFVNKFK